MKRVLIFYRGSLERSRLSLIIESAQQEGVSLSFMWIFPGKLTQKKKEHAEEFLKQYAFDQIEFRGETAVNLIQTNLAFRRWMKLYHFSTGYIVGFSAPLFALYKKSSKRIWFINGIPEEKGGGVLSSMMAYILWKLQGWASKASLVVTVSSRMSDYVRRRTNLKNLIHIPTCTSLDIFRPNIEKERKYFTYLGSGASWQALDWLEEVWYAIHQKDPSILFRVISRDARCKELGIRISPANIEFVSSSDFTQVASYLHDAEAGFLLRKDTIVNRVCFPTKLGEYLASGCWVVSSNIDWDVKDYFNTYRIGLLIDPKWDYHKQAETILQFRNAVQKDPLVNEIRECTAHLDRSFCILHLRNEIHQLI